FGAAHARAAPPRHPGMAKLLLQVADDRARPLSRARSVHPADEAEKHAAPLERRRADHAPGAGVLRLARVARAPSPAFLRTGGKSAAFNGRIVERIGCRRLLPLYSSISQAFFSQRVTSSSISPFDLISIRRVIRSFFS